MNNKKHAEAFALMRYESRDGRVVEYLWNSRDGVTPFGLNAKDGKTVLHHVDWRGDQFRPNHIPQPGDRIFVDFTLEHAKAAAERLYARESVGPHAELFRETYGPNKEAALSQILEGMKREVEMHGPAVEVVTAEMSAAFAAR